MLYKFISTMRKKMKYIELRIPAKYKTIFYEKRQKILEEIDKLLTNKKQFQPKDTYDIYDERVFLTVDELYYQKLEELSKRYKIKLSKLIRSIFFNLS